MWISMLLSQMSSGKEPKVPGILKMGRRGANIKVWTFLRLNQNQWFTAKEVSNYLELPISSVQFALRQLVVIAPRIKSEEVSVDLRGRREKTYRFHID